MEKYQIKSEIEHILDRSGMYMGSTNYDSVTTQLYVPSKNKMQSVDTLLNAGLQKLFDEILSNSVDEHRRADSLFKVNKIEVSINKCGTIIVRDNGGIPVKKHKQSGILIPELIFGHLRTSSNYDDTQERNVIGTNGLGAKLTNIFSKRFVVETCDGTNKITITWKNNMRECSVGEITKTKEHYTKIEFDIDLARFGEENKELMLSDIRQMQRRCIDACACNPQLTLVFESDIAEGKLNSTWSFPKFGEYIKLYTTTEQFSSIIAANTGRFAIGLVPVSIGQLSVGFVNGALCSQGTHIKILLKQITDRIITFCQKNDMELITEKDILTRLSIFVNCSVKNPTYDSQTKERLTNKLSLSDLRIPEAFFDNLLKSELIQALKDFYSIKYLEEQKKETRKLNSLLKSTKTSKKLITAGGSSNNKELWLFEGNSASNGFRKYRNPLTQSAYLLRGKIKNTFHLKSNQIVENVELREIIATLGLLFNEPQKNLKNLKYDKIIIDSDADYDGAHIAGLIIAFFAKHFPEIIRAGKLYRALSPIIICSKNKQKKYYYTLEEFEAEKHLYNNSWEIRYTKGLGGLDNDDYAIMLQQQKLYKFTIEDVEDLEYVGIWFERSSTQRKQILLEDENNYETA